MHTITTTLTLPTNYSHDADLSDALRSIQAHGNDVILLFPRALYSKLCDTLTPEQKTLITSELEKLNTGFFPFHIDVTPAT